MWNTSPFAGPADTPFPYANQILDITTASFIVPDSCPAVNPPYPYPSQHLPKLGFNATTSDGHPGSPITFTWKQEYDSPQPKYVAGKDYYAVFFHGVNNITVPFDTKTNSSTIPAVFDTKGIIIVVVATEPGAPTLESVVAGPLILLEQPATLTSISA